MKSPSRRDEVTKEWVEFMLTEFENRNTQGSQVTIRTWENGDATKKGEGFGGDLLKLEVKAIVQKNGVSLDKEYNHIVKFSTQNPIEKEFVKGLGNNYREIVAYSELIEELNKFQADLTNNMFPINYPTFVFARHNDEENVLVMENMKHIGYENKPKSEYLNLEEAKIALEQLARLHAISYAYDRKHKITEKYPIVKAQKLLMILTRTPTLLIDLVVDFLKIQGDYQHLIEKIMSSKSQIIEKSKKAFEARDQQQIFCLNHGDPWNNNILVRQSEDGSKGIPSVCFLDWEAIHWNTSAYDLNYFFAGASTPDIRMQHLDDLLQHYHNHFTEITNKLGAPITSWNYQKLKDEYDAMSTWGIFKSLGISLQLSEAVKELELVNHNATNNPIMKTIKKGVGKVMVSIILRPSMMKRFTNKILKDFMDPILKEMKSGENQVLNERYLAIILECDKRGLFDLNDHS